MAAQGDIVLIADLNGLQPADADEAFQQRLAIKDTDEERQRIQPDEINLPDHSGR